MSLDIKKPQTLPIKYIIKGHLWTPVILPTISTGSIHWSLWSIPWFCLISTVNPGCFEKGVFFTIPVSKKLITKTMGIHQTPTTLWVESYDGFRCIYSWLRGPVLLICMQEPQVFVLASQALTWYQNSYFRKLFLGGIPCIYNYIYIHGNGYWITVIWNDYLKTFGTPQPHVSSESVRETEWITSLSSNKPKEFMGATVPDGEKKWGYMWRIIRHAYKSARNKLWLWA